MRKLYVLNFFWLCQLTSVGASREIYTPKVYGEERYQEIWSRKPFSPPTPIATETKSQTEEDYTLSGLLKMGDQWIAFVQDRRSLKRHSVSFVRNEVGLQLVSVNEDAQASTVVLQAGEQVSTIRFDPSVLKIATDPSKVVVQNPETSNSVASPPQDISTGAENTRQPPSSAIKTLHSSMMKQ